MAIQATSFSMVSSGPMLTTRARELMMEGDWKKALALLMDGLEGMTYEYAIDILEGKSRLEGTNNNVIMVAESAEEAANLQAMYAAEFGFGGFVKKGSRMYQAYAVVDNLGFDDSFNVREMGEVAKGGTLRPEWTDVCDTVDRKCSYPWVFPWFLVENRALYYAHRPKTDFASIVEAANGRRVAVLFEETTEGSTPFWREKENTSIKAAYDQIAQYLPVTGFSQKFGEEHPSRRPKTLSVSQPQQQESTSQGEPAESLADELAAEAQRLALRKSECAVARAQVVAFADRDNEYGWRTFNWKGRDGMPNLTIRAPNRALHCYALSTTNAWNLQPEYKAFSPSGLKTEEDNPYHTDVWLGCGFDINEMTYDRKNPQYHAVVDLMFEVQKELLNFEVQVLARGPGISGTVVYSESAIIDKNSILVIPHAGVQYEVEALKAGAVICEVGGRLAHLVTVCRELNKPIIRMDNALAKLRRGQSVTINPDEGRVIIHPVRVPNYL